MNQWHCWPIESKSILLFENSLVVASCSCFSSPVNQSCVSLYLWQPPLIVIPKEFSGPSLHTNHLFSLHIPLPRGQGPSWSITHALACLTWLCFEPHIGCQNLSCFLALSLMLFSCHNSSLFLTLSRLSIDLLLYHVMHGFTQNQDQDTNIPNSLISDLFLFSSRQLSQKCKESTKGKGP